MKKTFLLSYKTPLFFMLSDWIDYDLQIEIVWFWGLRKIKRRITYRVYDYQDTKSFFKHWDTLIENRLPL